MRSFQPLPILAIVTVVAVGACGASPTRSSGPQGTPAQASVSPPTVAPTQAAATQPSMVTIVAPGTDVVPVEAALQQVWTATGDPAPSQACTESPAVDGDANVWAAPCWDNRFWVFDEDGAFVEAWGTKGSGPGQFDFELPSGDDAVGGIAFAPDGSFYTFDVGNLRIQHFDAKRKLIGSWGSFGSGDGQLAKPTDIAVSATGEVYVADGARGDVQVFDPDGAFRRSIGEGVGQPDHFAWFGLDADGGIYAAEQNHSIVRYGPDGQPLYRIDCKAIDGDTTDSAVGPDGNVFVSFTSDAEPFMRGLVEFDSQGTLLHRWPGIGDYIAVVDDGSAIIATTNHAAVVKKFALPKG